MAALTDSSPKSTAKVAMEYRLNKGNYEHINLAFELQEVSKDGESGEQLLLRVTETVEDILVDKVNAARGKGK